MRVGVRALDPDICCRSRSAGQYRCFQVWLSYHLCRKIQSACLDIWKAESASTCTDSRDANASVQLLNVTACRVCSTRRCHVNNETPILHVSTMYYHPADPSCSTPQRRTATRGSSAGRQHRVLRQCTHRSCLLSAKQRLSPPVIVCDSNNFSV
jgi:hypothetical protein